MAERRITPAEVLEAYQKTGLRPARRKWGDQFCCCPATALWEVAGAQQANKHGSHASCWLNCEYGHEYANGFVEGVDDEFGQGKEGSRYSAGMDDGIAAWQAVVAAGLCDTKKQESKP